MSDVPNLPRAASPLAPVLVCSLAILVLSVMDAAMKSLVLAVGVYNTVMWRSLLASSVSGLVWATGPLLCFRMGGRRADTPASRR